MDKIYGQIRAEIFPTNASQKICQIQTNICSKFPQSSTVFAAELWKQVNSVIIEAKLGPQADVVAEVQFWPDLKVAKLGLQAGISKEESSPF